MCFVVKNISAFAICEDYCKVPSEGSSHGRLNASPSFCFSRNVVWGVTYHAPLG